MVVRTRIAPSPTGDPHVGTGYIALFNMVFALHKGGQFILRVEDTDRARSSKKSEERILESLRWLGIKWNEGPDIGGDRGPYRQSERTDIYREHVEILLRQNQAFRCFCSPERLDELRAKQLRENLPLGYDGRCSTLSRSEVEKRLEDNQRYVVRMFVPSEGPCIFDDMLRGQISIDWGQIDMQVLLKEDGTPTYHLANVVDDHLMGISHVIRGEEWINSTPKHILLYQYFGWSIPMFCHLPLLRNPDKSKLSKRKNPTSILFYKRMGYLPEAMLNYLGRMGWSMPDDREKFHFSDMVADFDLSRVSLGGPVFDLEKLTWLNGVWIREELSDDELGDRLQEWALNRDALMRFLPLAKQRMETFSDIAALGGHLVSGMLPIQKSDLLSTDKSSEEIIEILQYALWRLEKLEVWDRESIFDTLKGLSEVMRMKLKVFLEPLFIAITGSSASISVMDSMHILGPDVSCARLRFAIDLIGGVSKKGLKRLEKTYSALD